LPPFSHRLRVRYNECDPQGVVFNANYFTYFDIAFTELWRAAVGHYDRLLEAGLDTVVAEASATFRASATFDDELEITARVVHLGTTSMQTELEVLRDGETVVEGRLRHVMIDAATKAKTPIPDWVRDGLGRLG
jgi:acyl-CoA thioester hydrolase